MGRPLPRLPRAFTRAGLARLPAAAGPRTRRPPPSSTPAPRGSGAPAAAPRAKAVLGIVGAAEDAADGAPDHRGVAGGRAGGGGGRAGRARARVAVPFEGWAWEGRFGTADGESGRAEWRDGAIRLLHPLGPGRRLPVLARGAAGPGTLEVGPPDG